MANIPIEYFDRSPDGSWTCLQPTTMELHGARLMVRQGDRFAPGQTLYGIEVAWLLDHENLIAAATRLGYLQP